MSGSQDDEGQNRDLWRRFADATGEPAQDGEIDRNVLAAYLDGTARPEEVEAVERAMATDASLVDAVAELRGALEGELMDVPQVVRARIKAALSADAGGERARLRSSVRRDRTAWYVGLAAAAAVLLVSFLGFQFGRYGTGADIDRTEAINYELAPKLEYADAESDLLAAFDRAGH